MNKSERIEIAASGAALGSMACAVVSAVTASVPLVGVAAALGAAAALMYYLYMAT